MNKLLHGVNIRQALIVCLFIFHLITHCLKYVVFSDFAHSLSRTLLICLEVTFQVRCKLLLEGLTIGLCSWHVRVVGRVRRVLEHIYCSV